MLPMTSASTTRESSGCCKDQVTGPTDPLTNGAKSNAIGSKSSNAVRCGKPEAVSTADHSGGRFTAWLRPTPDTNSSGKPTVVLAPIWSTRFNRISPAPNGGNTEGHRNSKPAKPTKPGRRPDRYATTGNETDPPTFGVHSAVVWATSRTSLKASVRPG